MPRICSELSLAREIQRMQWVSLSLNIEVNTNKSTQRLRPIVFVAHSLGGLLLEEAMNLSWHANEEHLKRIATSTSGLLLIGVPHHGAKLAEWAAYGVNMAKLVRQPNAELMRVLEPGSEMLASIQDRFFTTFRTKMTEKQDPKITCVWEELPCLVVGKVRFPLPY
jgi:predicted alpha/beta hydrolase family esterase